jgi:hypothetical protein
MPAPVTIDKLDISVYNAYALRMLAVEALNKQLSLDQAASIPPQTSIVNLYPKPTEIDILLGAGVWSTSWAFFFPPKRFEFRRRSPFSFYRVAPSLGSLEEQQEDEEKLSHVQCTTPEELKEKAVLEQCLKQMDKINEMIAFIVGRIGQFLQG